MTRKEVMTERSNDEKGMTERRKGNNTRSNKKSDKFSQKG
jgi:hypothetical protein